MGILRNLIGPSEKAIRQKALAQRYFWQVRFQRGSVFVANDGQQPSDTPVFLRKNGDGTYYTIASAATLIGILGGFASAATIALGK